MVELIIRKKLVGGLRLDVGRRLRASPDEARALITLGYAVRAEDNDAKKDEPKPKRKYKTRHMVAEE